MSEAPASVPLVYVQPWEYTRAPKRWIDFWNARAREVWAPSHFTAQSFRASGLAVPAVCMPNGVDTSRYRPAGNRLPLPTSKAFKFLYVGGTIWRKGADVAVNAFLRAFQRADDVCLVVKDLGSASYYRGLNLADQIRQAQSRPDAPEIVLIDEDLTDDELPSLYRAGDCLLSPYRGEAFGMPILEAQACGLPTIVSGWGAALDFCSEQTSWLLSGEVRPLTANLGELQTAETGQFFEPNVDHLIACMREAASSPELARRRGLQASQCALGYDWDRVAQLVRERIAMVCS